MSPEDRQTELFLTLLAEHSRDIYSTILRMVLNRSDADDIYQETNLVLWREFTSFNPDSNFRFWASRIAINQVMAWRKRLQRDRLAFSCEFLEAVAEEINGEMSPEMSAANTSTGERAEALSDCLSRLSARHRELIAQRYGTQLDVEAIARKYRRTPVAIYRLLQRIRQNLFQCIESKEHRSKIGG